MMQQTLFDSKIEVPFRPRYAITPREYQSEAVERCFELWNQAAVGCLLRIFTGGGKTICACMIADRWLSLDERNKVMIVSYEKQLVWQFAQEINDVLQVRPAIEMAHEEVDPMYVPRLMVASRQTLEQSKLASDQQMLFLAGRGLTGRCTFQLAKKICHYLRHGSGPEESRIEIAREAIQAGLDDYRYDKRSGTFSRLHKFNWEDNWLVVFDEAHKHAYSLPTVGHIVDWFSRNPNHRRLGMTATPKRSDKVSIGHKMFPGIAVDYPLKTLDGNCAVDHGYAVPYRQRYIKVHSIDFVKIKELTGTNTTKWDAEIATHLETKIGTLCEPLLDMVENRRTLIFSPSVATAHRVAEYVNARRKVLCSCGKTQWHSQQRIGDGAICSHCRRMIEPGDILATSEQQAVSLDGSIPPDVRRQAYEGHQRGQFQFLSVCGLCREGYNDPDIACVAVFRPVSRAASSLAEQMKGRGSRPIRGLIEALPGPEERLQAIQASSKPDCLIVDLVGCTGLGDCPTTVQIYAEGEPDDVVCRAQNLVMDGLEDVGQAIKKAKEEIAAEKEAKRKEREEIKRQAKEEADRRARAGIRVNYTAHEMGHTAPGPGMATEAQLKFLARLGIQIVGWQPTKRRAGNMITMLKEGGDPDDVVRKHGIKPIHWERTKASDKQKWALRNIYGSIPADLTPYEASRMFDRHKNGPDVDHILVDIHRAKTAEELTATAREAKRNQQRFTEDQWARILNEGQRKRSEIS